jgi:hypothetical protein
MEKIIQKYLLTIARNAIAEELGIKTREMEKPSNAEVLDEARGVFVTLEQNGQLRGCIGNIMPVYPLEEAVRKNASNAAFGDPRFTPVEKDEFDSIEIEISVLTVPEKLEYKDADDLLAKLQVGKDGVVLKKGYNEATYLPQVWEQVPDKEQFLGSLCMKAGLMMDEWKKGDLEVKTYRVEIFKEE